MAHLRGHTGSQRLNGIHGRNLIVSKLRYNKPFVYLISGRTVTNLGDSLFVVAAMWLIYELTGSAAYTGLAGFFIQAPRSLRFLAGPFVDRWRTRRILIATQLVNGALMAILPLAAVTGFLSVWTILVILPLINFVNQFVYPAQHKALPMIVEDAHLVRANSIFSMAGQATNMVFNAVGGVLIALVGTAALFAFNSLTFFLAAMLFAGVVIQHSTGPDSDSAPDSASDSAPDPDSDSAPGSDVDTPSETAATPDSDSPESNDEADDESKTAAYVRELRAGIQYIRGSTLMLLVIGVMGGNFAVGALLAVLPAFAALLGGPEVYGLLLSALAGGTLAGSLGASFLEDVPFGWLIAASLIISGLCLIATVLAPFLLLTIGLFLLVFVPFGVFNVTTWAMIQSAVDESMLGRVTSTVTSVSFIMAPVGSLIGGSGGEFIGITTIIIATAVVLVGLGVYFLARPQIRLLPKVETIDEHTLDLGTHDP